MDKIITLKLIPEN